jgi:hypothetical protein
MSSFDPMLLRSRGLFCGASCGVQLTPILWLIAASLGVVRGAVVSVARLPLQRSK